MTSDDRAKTPRTLLIADHLWEAFATMAVEMGGERDALINQALYTFARLNGFLVPADLKRLAPPQQHGGSGARAAPSAPNAGSGPRPVPAPPPVAVAPPPAEERPSRDERPHRDERPRAEAVARPAANPDRVAEIAQQLGSPSPRPPSAPPPVPSEGGSVQVDGSLLDEEHSLPTSMDLPNLAQLGLLPNKAAISTPPRSAPPPPSDTDATPGGARVLVLVSDGRELDRVVKDRFLIGRGKHCDLIINSGKVSREHAAITRDGSNYFIEDLGSSNGTWFDKRRITRRQIQEGDEYYICSEKIGCNFR